MDCDETRRWLTAHLDGELDLAQDVACAAHLKICADCAAAARSEAALRHALREKLSRRAPDPRLQVAIRAQLGALERERLVSKSRPRPLSWIGGLRYAGMLAAACLALAIGFHSGASHEHARAFGERIVADHIRALTSGRLVEVASTDRHTVKPWFAQHLDFSPPVVDLAANGFPLIGGRVDESGRESAAALVYQRNKHFISLFIWPAADAPQPGASSERLGYHVQTWRAGDFAFAAISDVASADLDEFVRMFRGAAAQQ